MASSTPSGKITSERLTAGRSRKVTGTCPPNLGSSHAPTAITWPRNTLRSPASRADLLQRAGDAVGIRPGDIQDQLGKRAVLARVHQQREPGAVVLDEVQAVLHAAARHAAGSRRQRDRRTPPATKTPSPYRVSDQQADPVIHAPHGARDPHQLEPPPRPGQPGVQPGLQVSHADTSATSRTQTAGHRHPRPGGPAAAAAAACPRCVRHPPPGTPVAAPAARHQPVPAAATLPCPPQQPRRSPVQTPTQYTPEVTTENAGSATSPHQRRPRARSKRGVRSA